MSALGFHSGERCPLSVMWDSPSLFDLCPLGIFRTLRDIRQLRLLIKAVVLLLEVTEEECLRLLFSAPSGFPFMQLHGAAH